MVSAEARVRETFKRIDHKNPISGHEWSTHGPTTGYEVVGPCGVCSKHTSETKANLEAAEWNDFYKKFPMPSRQ